MNRINFEMTDYEVDRALGYTPCVCGVVDGTWHDQCYRGKTSAQLKQGRKLAYAAAREHLEKQAAKVTNSAINAAISKMESTAVK